MEQRPTSGTRPLNVIFGGTSSTVVTTTRRPEARVDVSVINVVTTSIPPTRVGRTSLEV